MSNETNWDTMLDAIANDGKKTERNYWKFGGKEEGSKTIRLLPPLFTKGEKLFYFRFAVHYLNGKTYTCINQTLLTSTGETHNAESCPVCNLKEKLYRQGEKGSEEWAIAGKLKAKDLFFYRATLKDADDVTQVVFTLLPKTVHEELLEKFKSKRYGLIFDLAAGRDIVLTKKGKDLLSKYSWDLLDVSKISDDMNAVKAIAGNMLEKHYNELVTFPTKAEISEALKDMLEGKSSYGGGNPTGPDGDDTEEADVFKSAPVTTPKAKATVTPAPTKEAEPEDMDAFLADVFKQ